MTTPTPTQQAEALWIRAHEHVRRGDFANAVRDLAACFKILQQLGDPRLPEVHRRWTEVHALALEDAAHQKAAAAPKAEAQRPTLEAEAEAAANAGDLEKAIALLERAAAERPDNELVRERLAELKNARPRARELGADVAAEPVDEAQLEEAFAEDGIIDAVDEPVVQQPVVEQPVAVQHVEQPVVEAHVEQPVVEAHVEQPVVEAHVEQPVVEQHVEQPVVAQHVEQPVVEQHVEQPVVEQHVVEQHVEQPVVDQPDEPDEPVERTAILYAFEPAPVVVAAAEPVVDVAVEPVVAPVVAPVVEAVVEAAHEPVHQPVVGDGLDGGLSDSIDVDLASGPTIVAPGPDADIHTAATLVPAAAVELEAAVGNAETDFGDIDIDSGPGPSLTVEPMVEASVVPVSPIDDEPFTASVTAPNAAAADITSSLELATHAAHDDVHADVHADAATATVDAGASLELNTETKEVHVGGPTASFAVEQELQAGPAIELAVEPGPATEAPLMAAEDAPVGMPSLDVEIDMGAVVSATEADELPVAVDELEVVGDDMSVEAIVTLPPQAAPSTTADALPDDPVALLETLLERIAANRRAA